MYDKVYAFWEGVCKRIGICSKRRYPTDLEKWERANYKRGLFPTHSLRNRKMYDVAYAFCEEACTRLGIDTSHDVSHMARVAHITAVLNAKCGKAVTQEEENVMILAAFTHDLCDRKYVEPDSELLTIRTWLLSLVTEDQCDAVLKIITTMSYSKVSKCGYPTDLGKWELAYHHTRVADLIDAYSLRRCYEYQTHANPEMAELDKWAAVADLFESRVFTQKDRYILPVCPYAADIVEPLHAEAVEAVSLLKRLA